MRWRQPRLVWFLGLCCLVLEGCADLRWTGDGGKPSCGLTGGTVAPTANADPLAKTGLSPAIAEGSVPAASNNPQKNMLESQFAMSRLCERRGESEQAEQAYRILLQTAPNDVRLHHRLGVMAVQKGDFARAEEHFNTARSLAPPTAELLSDIGYCCYLQHKLPEAEVALNEALKLDPTYATAINNLALVLGKSGRLKESLELFMRTNSEAEAYANLGYVLAQNGDSARSKQMYLRALTLDNSMRAAAQAMLQIDEREQASQTAERPMDLDNRAS